MKIRYAAKARRDLASIAAYLDARNPTAAIRVGTSIRRVIERLITYPASGRRQDKPNVRRIVDPSFGYVVHYHLDDDGIVILAVQLPRATVHFGTNDALAQAARLRQPRSGGCPDVPPKDRPRAVALASSPRRTGRGEPPLLSPIHPTTPSFRRAQ